jgi:plastocyanin
MTSRQKLSLYLQTNATPASGASADFASDIDVLNYALTLEHLEAAFYEMAAQYDLGQDPYGNSINEYVELIRQHEVAHVETLTQVITDLGGQPVMAAQYDFGVTDAVTFRMVAATLENVGVSAYDGAASAIQNPDLLTAAGSIAAVEARHAAYLNVVTGQNPFPGAFETPLSMQEVLDAAGPFILSAATEASPAASASETTVAVDIVDFDFQPAELEIAAGTTVTWTNVGRQPHTATAEDGSFDTGVLTTDRSASHTFTEAGTYPYVCTLHENTMQAVLIVT